MIEHLVNEIERCLKNDLQIAALTMALTLPDTCGKVYHPQSSVSNRYTSWYDDHVLAPKSELTGDTSKRFLVSGNVVYKLRCAMLHESNPTVVGTEENITHFSLIWRPASSLTKMVPHSNKRSLSISYRSVKTFAKQPCCITVKTKSIFLLTIA